jgi:hypothetical protein
MQCSALKHGRAVAAAAMGTQEFTDTLLAADGMRSGGRTSTTGTLPQGYTVKRPE